MKLVFFDDFKLGVIRDNQVVDVRGAVSGITHSSPQDLINKIIADFDNTVVISRPLPTVVQECQLIKFG